MVFLRWLDGVPVAARVVEDMFRIRERGRIGRDCVGYKHKTSARQGHDEHGTLGSEKTWLECRMLIRRVTIER